MADAQDLKSCVALAACGFESHPRHKNFSRSARTRTGDLLVPNEARCQLRYTPILCIIFLFSKSLNLKKSSLLYTLTLKVPVLFLRLKPFFLIIVLLN